MKGRKEEEEEEEKEKEGDPGCAASWRKKCRSPSPLRKDLDFQKEKGKYPSLSSLLMTLGYTKGGYSLEGSDKGCRGG